jgi:hypothetical protein
MITKIIKNIYVFLVEVCAAPVVLVAAMLGRLRPKPIDIGLGPEPLINNVYHKKALTRCGYSAETFVNDVFFITDEFDVRGDRSLFGRHTLLRPWIPIYLFVRAVARYKCLYIYFNGGPLLNRKYFLWRLEPFLYKLAGIKIVVMPYGGDVQDLARTGNLLFKDAMARDYPQFRRRRQRVIQQIDLWTQYADHIISGCDWVEYMYHWDTLMLAHFSIDLETWQPQPARASAANPAKLRILHAPNHRTIKGTRFFLQAVEELQQEGVPLELVLLERVPNSKVREVMASVDVVADQLIIGWYAMFALEAMSMEKPVLCYLRAELTDLYVGAGLVKVDEIPIINCSPATVKETIRRLATTERAELRAIGQRSRAYVVRHHSLEAVGAVFDRINRSLGIQPQSTLLK